MTRSIIITGATGNLGRAVVEQLSNEGFFIETTVRGNIPKEFQKENIHSEPLNLLEEEACLSYIKQKAAQHSNISAAVLLVGGFTSGDLHQTDDHTLDKMINLNFKSAFHIVRPLMEQFEKQPEGGQIILIGSRAVFDDNAAKETVAYSLSKALIFQLANIINAAGKGKNITATVLVPSIIDTPVNRESFPNADYASWVQPEQIASAISFVLSNSGRQLRETVLKFYGNA